MIPQSSQQMEQYKSAMDMLVKAFGSTFGLVDVWPEDPAERLAKLKVFIEKFAKDHFGN